LINNNIKVAILYLHSEGKSIQHIANKFNVSIESIYRYIRDADKIKGQNTEDLTRLLLSFLLDKDFTWYND